MSQVERATCVLLETVSHQGPGDPPKHTTLAAEGIERDVEIRDETFGGIGLSRGGGPTGAALAGER